MEKVYKSGKLQFVAMNPETEKKQTTLLNNLVEDAAASDIVTVRDALAPLLKHGISSSHVQENYEIVESPEV